MKTSTTCGLRAPEAVKLPGSTEVGAEVGHPEELHNLEEASLATPGLGPLPLLLLLDLQKIPLNARPKTVGARPRTGAATSPGPIPGPPPPLLPTTTPGARLTPTPGTATTSHKLVRPIPGAI